VEEREGQQKREAITPEKSLALTPADRWRLAQEIDLKYNHGAPYVTAPHPPFICIRFSRFEHHADTRNTHNTRHDTTHTHCTPFRGEKRGLEERSRRDSTQGRDKGSIRRWAAAVLCERCCTSHHHRRRRRCCCRLWGVSWWWWRSEEGTTPAKQQTTPAKEAKSAVPKKETPQDRLKRLMRQKLNKQSTTHALPPHTHTHITRTRIVGSPTHPITHKLKMMMMVNGRLAARSRAGQGDGGP
jgi:hypothetical protein